MVGVRNIEGEWTAQWPERAVQGDKQRSTRHTRGTGDRVARTPLKAGGELRCSRKGKQYLSLHQRQDVMYKI